MLIDEFQVLYAARRLRPKRIPQSRKARRRRHALELIDLLADLATICANHVQPTSDLPAFTILTTPTPLQRRALELLGVSHRHGFA